MITLTHEQLGKALPFAKQTNIDKYLPFFNKFFSKYNLISYQRIAAFLAQIAEESGSLRYVEELASGKAYEFRKDLGNLEHRALKIAHQNYTTTGKFYKGHGLIQITGYYNHVKAAKALNIPCDIHPKLLCTPEYAVQSALWYWDTHNCNSLADVNNFSGITRAINGGLTNYTARCSYWETTKKALNIN